MTLTSPDFRPIQKRLARLGLYSFAIDDEWGTGMRDGVGAALTLLEQARELGPLAEAPTPPVSSSGPWPRLPAGYAWLRGLGPVPRHLSIALGLLGTLETPGAGDSATILGWRDELKQAGISIVGYSADSVPWCGLFVQYVMYKADRGGVEAPLWALNWSKYGQDGGQPELGDVLTFKRTGGGHVAFYIAEDREGYYHVLGGNQSDKVSITRIAKTRMHACRQPPYQNKPASVRPYLVSPTGAVSSNEA